MMNTNDTIYFVTLVLILSAVILLKISWSNVKNHNNYMLYKIIESGTWYGKFKRKALFVLSQYVKGFNFNPISEISGYFEFLSRHRELKINISRFEEMRDVFLSNKNLEKVNNSDISEIITNNKTYNQIFTEGQSNIDYLLYRFKDSEVINRNAFLSNHYKDVDIFTFGIILRELEVKKAIEFLVRERYINPLDDSDFMYLWDSVSSYQKMYRDYKVFINSESKEKVFFSRDGDTIKVNKVSRDSFDIIRSVELNSHYKSPKLNFTKMNKDRVIHVLNRKKSINVKKNQLKLN